MDYEGNHKAKSYEHDTEISKLRLDITELRKELTRQRDDLQNANLKNTNLQE
jgi:hypothetical protein